MKPTVAMLKISPDGGCDDILGIAEKKFRKLEDKPIETIQRN